MFIQFLILSVYGELFVSFEEMLDPASISWPKAWVANNAELSTNHAGQAATLILCFSTNIDIPASDAAITIKGYDDSTYHADITETAKGSMITARFDIGNLPVAGSYGPISLVISVADGGSIIASSQSFAEFAVIGSVPISEDLNVVWATNANLVVSEATSLEFSFTITKAIERYDYFVISLSDSFGFDYNKAKFSWTDGSEYFNETQSDYDLDSNSITVYGVVNPVYDDTLVTFTLSGFSNPRAKGISSSWSITYYRFGASTTIEIFGGTLSGTSLTTGAISFVSWSPVNDYISKSEIVADLVIFMNLKFTLAHDLVADDYIKITYNSAVVDLTAYTYTIDSGQALTEGTGVIISKNYELDCIIDSTNVVTCTANSDFSGTVSIINLIQFGTGTPSITTVKSYDSTDKDIDSSGKIGEFSYAVSADVVLIDEEVWVFPVYNAESNSMYSVSYSAYNSINHFVVSFKAMVNLVTSQEIDVYYPIDNSAIALTKYLTIPNTIHGIFTNCLTTLTDVTFSDNTDADLTIFSVETGILTFQTGMAYSANEYSSQYFSSKDADLVNQNIFTPLFSNQDDSTAELVLRYEVNSISYIFSKPMSFVYDEPYDYNMATFCRDVRLDGAPIQIYYRFSFDYAL
jgi:hypothetical protein